MNKAELIDQLHTLKLQRDDLEHRADVLMKRAFGILCDTMECWRRVQEIDSEQDRLALELAAVIKPPAPVVVVPEPVPEPAPVLTVVPEPPTPEPASQPQPELVVVPMPEPSEMKALTEAVTERVLDTVNPVRNPSPAEMKIWREKARAILRASHRGIHIDEIAQMLATPKYTAYNRLYRTKNVVIVEGWVRLQETPEQRRAESIDTVLTEMS